MVVLSVEGSAFASRKNWTTHKILGVFATKAEAMESPLIQDLDLNEDICIVTDLETNTVERVGFNS